MHVTVDDFNSCDGLECIYVKYKSCASTACESPFCRLNMSVNSMQHSFLCNKVC